MGKNNIFSLENIDIQGSLIYLLNNLNNGVYATRNIILVVGLIIATIFISKNMKNYLYRYELSKCIKISLFIVVTGYIVRVLKITMLIPVFYTIFCDLMPTKIV